MIAFWIIFGILVLCFLAPILSILYVKYMAWMGKLLGIVHDDD